MVSPLFCAQSACGQRPLRQKALQAQAVRKTKTARQTMPNVTIEKRILVPFLSTPISSDLVLSVNAVPLRIRHYQYTKRRTVCQRFFNKNNDFLKEPTTFASTIYLRTTCRFVRSNLHYLYDFLYVFLYVFLSPSTAQSSDASWRH